jgi:hypothetical protein
MTPEAGSWLSTAIVMPWGIAVSAAVIKLLVDVGSIKTKLDILLPRRAGKRLR